jgi:hypothetical protein
MARRYKRRTDRRRQDERQLSVRAVRRSTPDVQKLSRAIIGLAMARAAQAEADAQAEYQTSSGRGGPEPGDEPA